MSRRCCIIIVIICALYIDLYIIFKTNLQQTIIPTDLIIATDITLLKLKLLYCLSFKFVQKMIPDLNEDAANCDLRNK